MMADTMTHRPSHTQTPTLLASFSLSLLSSSFETSFPGYKSYYPGIYKNMFFYTEKFWRYFFNYFLWKIPQDKWDLKKERKKGGGIEKEAHFISWVWVSEDEERLYPWRVPLSASNVEVKRVILTLLFVFSDSK
jgi:hypothetical protein